VIPRAVTQRSGGAIFLGFFGLLTLVVTVELSRGTLHAWAWRAVATTCFVVSLPGGWRWLVVAAPVMLAYEPFGWGGAVGLVMYVPLYLLLQRRHSHDAAGCGIAIALMQTVVLSAWASPATPKPQVTEWLLVCVAILIWSASTTLIHRQLCASGSFLKLTSCMIIPAAEWLRTQTHGLVLPNHLTAHAIAQNFWLTQLAEPLGILGLSLFGCMVGLMVALALGPGLLHRRRSLNVRPLLFAAGLIIGGVGFAEVRVRMLSNEEHRIITVRVVQEYEPDGVRSETVELRFAAAVRRAVALRDADLIVLPENAMYARSPLAAPSAWLAPTAVEQFLRDHDNHAPIVGGVTVDVYEQGDSFPIKVSAWVLAANYQSVMRDKLIFAPVGESPPFDGWPVMGRIGQWIGGDLPIIVTEDPRATLTITPEIEANLCFCFEYLIPGIWTHRSATTSSDLQLCLADVSAFGYSKIERLQNQAARRLRAVELRTPFLFVADGGSELYDRIGVLKEQMTPDMESSIWNVQVASERSRWTLILMHMRATYGPPLMGIILAIALALGWRRN